MFGASEMMAIAMPATVATAERWDLMTPLLLLLGQ
jgi:hypothetical protein